MIGYNKVSLHSKKAITQIMEQRICILNGINQRTCMITMTKSILTTLSPMNIFMSVVSDVTSHDFTYNENCSEMT